MSALSLPTFRRRAEPKIPDGLKVGFVPRCGLASDSDIAARGVRSLMTQHELRVQVVGDDVVVTLPGYSYTVTYYKPKDSVTHNDLRLQMTGAEFFVEAWKRAYAKARELGWIV